MHTLNQLLARIAEAGFEFVVIGGYAAVLHGSALVTRDLDIFAVLSDDNVARLREILRDIHPMHRLTSKGLSFLEQPPPGTKLSNLYLRTDYGVVDVLGSVLGLEEFEAIRDRAEWIEIGGHPCRLISLDDLIRAKEAVGREKDLLAVKELRAIAAIRARQGGA